MAKSIRASDEFYRLADSASAGAHRSLTQQIEAAGVTTVEAPKVIEGDRRARERALLKAGLATPESMYLFPVALARKTKVRFPELEGK